MAPLDGGEFYLRLVGCIPRQGRCTPLRLSVIV